MDNCCFSYALFKRSMDRYSVDPVFRTAMDRAPADAVRSAIYSILYGKTDEYTAGNPYVGEFNAFVAGVSGRIVSAFRRENIPSEQLFYYLDTQRNRCRVESRSIRMHPMIYYFPCAFELSSGCSVQCSFCGLRAEKYRESFLHTEKNAALLRTAVRTVQEYAGGLAGFCPCYFATEPMDNPDYEAFLEDIRIMTGTVPQTTTAVAEREPERIRCLMAFYGEEGLHNNASLRLSVRSLRQFGVLTDVFSPEELKYVEILANNPESVNGLSCSGRAMENLLMPEYKRVKYSISCIAGVKINFCEKTIAFMEPELPGSRYPLGYRVLEERTFSNELSLSAGIRELYDRYAVGRLPAEGRLSFNVNTKHSVHENSVIFRGDRKVPPVINYLGRVLPPAVMAMLVVYCYKGIDLHTPEGFLPELIAGLLTVGSYCWKKNTLLSILLGTVTCMVLRQFVF